MKTLLKLTVALSMLLPSLAYASTLEEGLRLFKDEEYEDAALTLYSVLQNDPNPDNRDQAIIYLGETLVRMDLLVPGMFYFRDIFEVGRANRYYLNAIEGLMTVQEKLHDSLLVPSLFNNNLDPKGFGQLDSGRIAKVNFMIGELMYRQNKRRQAKAYLSAVGSENRFIWSKAKYLLGLLAAREKRDDDALVEFQAVIDGIPADSIIDQEVRIRNLALVAKARQLYGLEKYQESADAYADVPRFSEAWFSAMYEGAWAYYKQENYGRALGELHSVTSPYFTSFFIPEAYVIQGITYFVNCQWDRVRRAVETYKATYSPVSTSLSEYLDANKETAKAYYEDVVSLGGGIPAEVARDVRKSHKFREYHYMLEHIKWESRRVAEVSEWSGSRLADDLMAIIEDQLAGLEVAVGGWTKNQIASRAASLKQFESQIDLIDLEVSEAEVTWLDAGRETLKGRRARLPRPDIESDQWQHWSFKKEYWKGELGYFQHSIRSECE